MHYLKKFIKKGSVILDGCAGTGNYAFPLAESGYEVVAGDVVPANSRYRIFSSFDFKEITIMGEFIVEENWLIHSC